ncbi:hypothetical protein [Levilactobacillus wangkuiensis]|uniref:hypothetical protein n=1 Tax=Levilactobacillus wangkuiensis TaxID=2799566 RepID=UPI001942532F|nr:hypothetical protein [Levilactobacillus wangkuiensis]
MKTGGTGGAHTNQTGLKFEKQTDLAFRINKELSNKYFLKPHIFKNNNKNKSKLLSFDLYRINGTKRIGIISKKKQFYNVLSETYGIENKDHKNWEPDEAFFNEERNTVFIVEKKWQSHTGSADEKVLGFVNKRRIYQSMLNNYIKNGEPKPSVEFSALFNSSWWLHGAKKANVNISNEQRYQDYFDSLRSDGIKIFFDNYDYWWFGL